MKNFLVNKSAVLILFLGLAGCRKKQEFEVDKQVGNSTSILDDTIKQIMDKYHVPGLAIVIMEHGVITSSKFYGFKNIKIGDLVDENTVFEAASLSKPVFAYGVLKLVEKGQLDLDKPLTYYFVYDDIKNDPRAATITARMVLSHTTGFPNWRSKNEDLKTHFQPGEKFSYSGEGIVYLQKLIEKITGQPLEEYMQKNVLAPLGMTHSSYIWQKEYDQLKAAGHDKAGNPPSWFRTWLIKILRWLNIVNPAKELANAAASLHTTALDYAKFVQAIVKDVGLKTSTIDAMLTPQIWVPNDIKNNSGNLSSTISWGLGLGLQKISNGTTFWHWGDNPDFKNYITGSKDGRTIIIFTNGDNGMKAMPEIIYQITGMREPALDWLHY